jgi:hypothetical protein
LKGIKEKGCDIRNNYSGKLYSGMHTFVGQKEENVQVIYISNGKKNVNIPGTGFRKSANSCRRRCREGTEN